jgi:hypothetical protein
MIHFRPQLRFSLRTLIALVAVPCVVLAYRSSELEWLRQRREYLLDEPKHAPWCNQTRSPFTIFCRDFGYDKIYWSRRLPYTRERVQWLFPESQILETP